MVKIGQHFNKRVNDRGILLDVQDHQCYEMVMYDLTVVDQEYEMVMYD
jgi:hypothetical protein